MTGGGRFDPSGSLYVPDYLLDEEGPVSVLIDPERVHWIGTNRLGRRVLEQIRSMPGMNSSGLAMAFPEYRPAAATDVPQSWRRFLMNVHRRGFLANERFAPVVRGNRREVMEPHRLHEFWVVTNDDCNLRCRHCYTIDRVKQGRTGIPGQALRGIIEEAHALGTEVFYFTGGEPTRRHDFLELAEFVLARAKLILFTNGTTISDEMAARLAPHRDRLVVQVSVEGPDEATNRPVRGKDSHARSMAGIETLLRHAIRVGVSTTPTGVSKEAVVRLTEQLATMEVNGQRPDYHHLILLLDRGGAQDHQDIGGLRSEDLTTIVSRSAAAIRTARAADRSLRMQLTNEKIMHALASNGPPKDLCGSGYTILGVSADGQLLPCAACMDDERFFLGDLLQEDLSYRPGTLRELWLHSESVERIRRLSLSAGDGQPVRDLRYFHGGGCWKNMPEPGAEFASSHPFAAYYEQNMRDAIRQVAHAGVEVQEEGPELYTFMHRARIACSGARKTRPTGSGGDHGDVDQGHCICFA